MVVGGCSVTERHRWRPPYQAGKNYMRTVYIVKQAQPEKEGKEEEVPREEEEEEEERERERGELKALQKSLNS